MDRIIKIIAVVLAIAAAVWFVDSKKGVTRSAEGLGEPVQTDAKGSVQMQTENWDVNIEYKASYKIDALVVHTKNYSGTSLSDELAKRDFALAWGDVAAKNAEIDFHWSQSGRWYSWSLPSYEEADSVGGTGYINTHSANCHLIPADDNVKEIIKSVKMGDVVHIDGYLVYITAKSLSNDSTSTWNSSLSRNDTGAGACEVIYVTNITVS